MNLDKSVLTVSRQWHNPNILVWVNDEEIGMGMKLSDFMIALAKEIGNPALLLTNSQLLTKLNTAASNITEGMKAQSSQVM